MKWELIDNDPNYNAVMQRAPVIGGWLVRTTIAIPRTDSMFSALPGNQEYKFEQSELHDYQVAIAFVPDATYAWDIDADYIALSQTEKLIEK